MQQQRVVPSNNSFVTHPYYEEDQRPSGWFVCDDHYLKPQVIYKAFPLSTTVHLGGRSLTIDRAVTVKIRLLEPHEDRLFWTSKPQHADRLNLGTLHPDFQDVEVAYSESHPQTHVWFSGYSIHLDCCEALAFNSYNATVRTQPEEWTGKTDNGLPCGAATDAPPYAAESPAPVSAPQFADLSPYYKPPLAPTSKHSSCSAEPRVSSFQPLRRTERIEHYASPLRYYSAEATPMRVLPGLSSAQKATPHVITIFENQKRTGAEVDCLTSSFYPNESARYSSAHRSPTYSVQVPEVYEIPGKGMRYPNRNTEYRYTADALNDCERPVHYRDAYNIQLPLSKTAIPAAWPLLHAPPAPYSVPQSMHHYRPATLAATSVEKTPLFAPKLQSYINPPPFRYATQYPSKAAGSSQRRRSFCSSVVPTRKSFLASCCSDVTPGELLSRRSPMQGAPAYRSSPLLYRQATG